MERLIARDVGGRGTGRMLLHCGQRMEFAEKESLFGYRCSTTTRRYESETLSLSLSLHA